MRQILTTIYFACLTSSVFCQWATFNGPDGQFLDSIYLKPLPASKMVLYDSSTKISFYLDSNRINITAVNNEGRMLWTKDPWKENKLGPYRTTRPLIMEWGLTLLEADDAKIYKLKKAQQVIWIVYHNSQFGFITLLDGRFYFEGQD